MAHKSPTERRKARVRRAVKAAANGRVRLSVHRSSKHIYAQVIDDTKGVTLVSASSLEKVRATPARLAPTSLPPRQSASWSPSAPTQKGVKNVVFDRGRYMYHGRVKALADAAREGGLSF